MVFIHGGGFKEGSSSRLLYGPDYLVAKGVLLVTFNYRLSALGFLCLGMAEAPGNAAMKDQVAALRWVRRNIRAFGGDPDNVTIFGESAGGASVSYHVLSSMSKGLFHRAIAQSGSALAPWAEQHDPVGNARALAVALGEDRSLMNSRELYDLFMEKTPYELVSARIPVPRGQLVLGQTMFTPCVERTIDGEEAFLTDTPIELLSRGQYNRVPMIIGTNSEEGYFFGGMETEESLAGVTFKSALPHDLRFPSPRERGEFTQLLKRLYAMDDGDISLSNIVRTSKLHGEPYFSAPAVAETELLLRSADAPPIYNYLFAYDGWRNFPKWMSGMRVAMAPGASHADDLFYLFRLFPVPTLFEGEFIDTLTTWWTHFAKYGEPGGGWRRTRPSRPRALLIDGAGAASSSTRPLAYSASLRAWRDAYAAHRATVRPPFDHHRFDSRPTA